MAVLDFNPACFPDAARLRERSAQETIPNQHQNYVKGIFGAPVKGRPVDQKWDKLTNQLYTGRMKAVNISSYGSSRTASLGFA